MTERLKHELAATQQELKAHMASWEYAFAYGARPNDHPKHAATRQRTEELRRRIKDLKALIGEHEA